MMKQKAIYSPSMKNVLMGELFVIVFFALAGTAQALPFNDDMVDVQPRTGELMRPLPEKSIPSGSLKYRVRSKAEAEALENPIPQTSKSVVYGERLFRVNCYVCHGDLAQDNPAPPIGSEPQKAMMIGPNISDPMYLDRTDGYLYGVIHFGGLAIMPPLGWKMAPEEHWHIVNYLRDRQQARAAKVKKSEGGE